jgi:hypothetical protein
VELCQACLTLALHGQHPAPPAGAKPDPERKLLRSRQGQQGVGVRLDRRDLASAVRQEGGPVL